MSEPNGRAGFVVLVVEDDPLVRLDMVCLAEDIGLTALEAANADKAIALLERHPEIRVLITDIEMPGSMDGLKLASAVRDRWPPIKIIVTSGRKGFTSGDMPVEGIFLPKPYLPAAVREALNHFASELGY